MDGQYLIPANSKKSMLYFSMFRMIDLIIFGIGASISFILLTTIQSNNIWLMVLKILPAAICALLVMPVPYQHNVLVALTNIYQYFSKRRTYKWKGWCFGDGSDE